MKNKPRNVFKFNTPVIKGKWNYIFATLKSMTRFRSFGTGVVGWERFFGMIELLIFNYKFVCVNEKHLS
ncbi:MAG: hypothetical protein VSS75_001365, partial [Candidatus Parabeggiatoa sp.]|nr:hypothetical protein [Candidatus Parabeggiatoa sp.]